jgi:hypothetical protein
LYIVGVDMMMKSYWKNQANSGKKCIGRIMQKYSLYALAALAVGSSLLLMKDADLLKSPFLDKIISFFKRK